MHYYKYHSLKKESKNKKKLSESIYFFNIIVTDLKKMGIALSNPRVLNRLTKK